LTGQSLYFSWTEFAKHSGRKGHVELTCWTEKPNINVRLPFHSFKGHPGPSQVADEVGPDFVEVLRVGHNRAFMRER